MDRFRWPLSLLVCLVAVTGAGLLSPSVPWRLFAGSATAEDPPPAVASADELSSAFRWVSTKALPAVVSIETTGRTETRRVMTRSPFAGDPFLRQFLGDRLPDLEPRGREMQFRRPGGQGSGFLIDSDGIIMTNAHVVRGAANVRVRLSDGREFDAVDVRADERSDIAIVRIDVDESLPCLPLGDDASMEIGDWVLAFGSPFGLHRTVTQGIISAKARGTSDITKRQEFLQTDAAINPGNSGGPLVNLRGEVIGINTAISTSSGGYDGIGFAVPVSQARWVADQLIDAGEVERAYIGIIPEDIDAEIAAEYQLDVPRGVVLRAVTKGSPADRAGLEAGDVLLQLNGVDIRSARQLQSVAEKLRIGESYPLTRLRDGQESQLKVTVESLNLASRGRRQFISDAERVDLESLGLSLQMIDDAAAERFGLDGVGGAVITEVQRGSLADRVGLEPGFVIQRIGDTPIRTAEDLREGLEAAAEDGKLRLFLETPNARQMLAVPFTG